MMKTTQHDQLVHVEAQSKAIDKAFADQFYTFYAKLEKENIVLNLSALALLEEDDVHWIKCMANDVRDQGKSFVICSFPNELPVTLQEIEYTPTFNEAQDLIYMDEVERSLEDEDSL